MSGTYPTDPEFQTVGVQSKHRNVYSETVSGRIQARSLGKQQWIMTAKYNPMTRQEFSPVYAFVISQAGRLGTFTIVPPVVGSTRGTATGTVTVSSNVSGGNKTVPISGLTGDLKAGDFVKFGSHTKVYMLTADRSGSGNMSIEPALVEDVSSGDSVTYNDVAFTMRLNNDVQEYSLSANEYYEYEIDMIEAI